MRKLRLLSFLAALLLAAPVLPACDLDVGDLNNPAIDDLENNPTPSGVASACTGLLIGARRNHAQANGFVAQLSILGRDAYNFDQADPRFIGELLQGSLNPGSPFGGNFWAGPYANIRMANIILTAVDKVADFTEEEKSAIRGYARTMKAYDLLEVIVTRDENGAVIDTDRALDEELAPVEDKDAVYAEITALLDTGADELANGGMAFPFALSSGFAGFDDPAGFLLFNRALAARVAVYVGDYDAANAALDDSFIDTTVMTVEGLEVGVYHAYSTGSGDAVNNLINPNIFAHPTLETGVQAGDARYARKIVDAEDPGAAQGLASDIKFAIYTSPSDDVPIIRNEELILLRAEALFFTGNVPGALEALNVVRTVSGGLAPIAGTPTEEEFVTALLYERRYSLMFEWGHRWIDTRRLGRTADLPLDGADHVRNVRYPIPLAECNARPDEPACAGGSQE